MEKELPIGWVETELGEILQVEMGQSPPSESYNDKGVGLPFFQGKAEFGKIYPTIKKYTSDAIKIVEKDTILLSVRAPVGPTNISNVRCCIGRGLSGISSPFIPSSFIFYYFRVIEVELSQQGTGSTFTAINKKLIEGLKFPLPPPPEQQRIVAKLDTLFGHLDTLKTRLDRIPQLLKDFRQKVLTQAVTGKLTEEWREGKELEEWKELPLNDLAYKITDGEHFRPEVQESGIPFLSAKDVRENGVDFSNTLFISEKLAGKALKRCNPEYGDILIVSRGATVGRMCMVNTTRVFCLLGSVILIKTNKSINNKYLLFALKAPELNDKIVTVSGSSAQQAIYLRDIKNILVFYPPIAEQQEIVHRVESLFAKADKIEASYQKLKEKTEQLPQALLAKAFRGELVEQLPTDGDARDLLEEIKKLKGEGAGKGTGAGKKLKPEEEVRMVAEDGARYEKKNDISTNKI